MNLTGDLKQIELTVAKLIAKAWSDSNFKKRLIDNTAEVLRESGLAIEAVVNADDAAVPGLRLAANGSYEIAISATPSNMVDEKLNRLEEAHPGFCICFPNR